jgi:leader peptidase (prepilin peptidase) / N-methyltransferase
VPVQFLPEVFWAACSFLFGAIVGSFLNVVIVRLPQGKSIVFPSSQCPACGQNIRFYDTIPILSFLLLGGRCRTCGARISIHYPLVEFITGGLCTAIYLKWGLTPAAGVFFIFCSSMVAVFWIDLHHMIIPDAITLNGMAVGIVAAILGFVPGVDCKLSLIGLVLGGAILYLPAVVYKRIRGVEGLGGGDIKLLAMMGAFTGPYGVVFILFVSSLIGSVAALLSMGFRPTGAATPIPFGPFLTASAVLYVFAGQEIIAGFYEVANIF